jgi:hypothetical protein
VLPVSLVQDSIGLGSILIALPLTVVGFYQIRGYHAASEARHKAEQVAVKQDETDRITRLIESYLRPSNGKTPARVGEDTRDMLEDLTRRLENHMADSRLHLPPPPPPWPPSSPPSSPSPSQH